jgi:hypothetical protein
MAIDTFKTDKDIQNLNTYLSERSYIEGLVNAYIIYIFFTYLYLKSLDGSLLKLM